MNKREYAEFHKYLAMLIYEYNKILNCPTLTDETRKGVEDVLVALEKVQKICIIRDKKMNKEINIITLDDIFKNIETEEKAFNFKDYIINLQQENKQLKEDKKKAREFIKENFGKTGICISGSDLPYSCIEELLEILGDKE